MSEHVVVVGGGIAGATGDDGDGGSDNAVDVMVVLVMMTMSGKRGETSGAPQNRTSQTVLLRYPQKALKESEW